MITIEQIHKIIEMEGFAPYHTNNKSISVWRKNHLYVATLPIDPYRFQRELDYVVVRIMKILSRNYAQSFVSAADKQFINAQGNMSAVLNAYFESSIGFTISDDCTLIDLLNNLQL